MFSWPSMRLLCITSGTIIFNNKQKESLPAPISHDNSKHNICQIHWLISFVSLELLNIKETPIFNWSYSIPAGCAPWRESVCFLRLQWEWILGGSGPSAKTANELSTLRQRPAACYAGQVSLETRRVSLHLIHLTDQSCWQLWLPPQRTPHPHLEKRLPSAECLKNDWEWESVSYGDPRGWCQLQSGDLHLGGRLWKWNWTFQQGSCECQT